MAQQGLATQSAREVTPSSTLSVRRVIEDGLRHSLYKPSVKKDVCPVRPPVGVSGCS